MIEITIACLGAALGGTFVLIISYIYEGFIIKRYTREYNLLKKDIDRFLEEAKIVREMCLPPRSAQEENKHKFQLKNYELGFGTGNCPRCGNAIYDNEVIKTGVHNESGDELVRCSECGLELN